MVSRYQSGEKAADPFERVKNSAVTVCPAMVSSLISMDC